MHIFVDSGNRSSWNKALPRSSGGGRAAEAATAGAKAVAAAAVATASAESHALARVYICD